MKRFMRLFSGRGVVRVVGSGVATAVVAAIVVAVVAVIGATIVCTVSTGVRAGERKEKLTLKVPTKKSKSKQSSEVTRDARRGGASKGDLTGDTYGKSEIETLNLTVADGESFDSVADSIILTGYDKRLSSSVESFIVGNNTGRRLKCIDVDMLYETVDGEMLHREVRHIEFSPMLPSSERRTVDVSSFDRQGRYYYYKSKKPRRGGVAYKTAASIVGVTIEAVDTTSDKR